MTGDGTNDAPALAQADVGVAMNTGTQAAKEAGNMVDLDSNPTKLLEVVEVGKQLLMTRGCLTTFSIANDVAKYFAILPALFMAVFPEIAPLNVMGLASPESAILSAVIFNALIIVALIPLALRGVQLPPAGRRGAAAPLAADLRRGRRHRAVRGHQAHRPGAEPPSGSSKEDCLDEASSSIALRMTAGDPGAHRACLPAGRHRARPGAVPAAGERQPRHGADGRVVGSELIGQALHEPGLLPAAPVGGRADGYDAAASAGSNLGPTSQKLRDRVAADVERLQSGEPAGARPGPGRAGDRLRAAASTRTSRPEAARWQVPRVAAARGVAVERGRRRSSRRTSSRAPSGFLGEPRVNVLLLNLALDERFGPPRRRCDATSRAAR